MRAVAMTGRPMRSRHPDPGPARLPEAARHRDLVAQQAELRQLEPVADDRRTACAVPAGLLRVAAAVVHHEEHLRTGHPSTPPEQRLAGQLQPNQHPDGGRAGWAKHDQKPETAEPKRRGAPRKRCNGMCRDALQRAPPSQSKQSGLFGPKLLPSRRYELGSRIMTAE